MILGFSGNDSKWTRQYLDSASVSAPQLWPSKKFQITIFVPNHQLSPVFALISDSSDTGQRLSDKENPQQILIIKCDKTGMDYLWLRRSGELGASLGPGHDSAGIVCMQGWHILWIIFKQD